jgi:hypothetical protein
MVFLGKVNIEKKIWRWWTTGGFAEWWRQIEWRTATEFQEFFLEYQGNISRISCLVGQVVNKKNTNFINAIIVNVLGDNTERGLS